jgi:cytochrome c oxidase assembly protein subunit 15
MSDTKSLSGVYRFAVATSCCTILLLVAGALVTSNDAADSVPDWPLAYHRIIPPLVGGIRYEYTHRVLAGLVSIFTLILAVWLTRSETRPIAKRLGWTAFGLVIAQAVLGGIRVLEGHPAVSATAHAVLAQIFFITIVSLTLYLSPWWQRDLPLLDDSRSPSARSITALTTVGIFVQLILGAGFRHDAWGINPHIVGAFVLLGMVVWTGIAIKRRFRSVRELRRGAALLHATFGTQILLGIGAYWVILKSSDDPQPGFLFVSVTVAHVLVGALTLAASVLLTLSCFRLTRPATSVASVESTGVSRA